MRILHEKPPFYDRVAATFDLEGKDPLFTYGDVIYNPGGNDIDPSIIEHEQVHMRQQEILGKDLWWDAFLLDPAFRLQQELEANRTQYRHMKSRCSDRNFLAKYAQAIAEDLTGPMYGNVGTVQDVLAYIRG